MIPEGFDPGTGFPPGYVAEVDGHPVRRVATNGDPIRRVGSWTDYRTIIDRDVDRGWRTVLGLERDRAIFGDAYVDKRGRRIDPRTVVVESRPPGISR